MNLIGPFLGEYFFFVTWFTTVDLQDWASKIWNNLSDLRYIFYKFDHLIYVESKKEEQQNLVILAVQKRATKFRAYFQAKRPSRTVKLGEKNCIILSS